MILRPYIPRTNKGVYVSHQFVPHLRSPPPPIRAVKTCYRFDDEDEDNDDEAMKKHLQECEEKRKLQRQQHQHISCLNKLYYDCHSSDSCCGADLVDWMKRKWGKLHVMKFVRINGEMTLRVYREEHSTLDDISTSPVSDFYEEIAFKLNDCLRMDYVKYQLLTKINTFRRGDLSYIDIPLSIYYDGTM